MSSGEPIVQQEKSEFSKKCEAAGQVLLMLAKQGEQCTEPVQFDQAAFLPCLGALADVLKEFAKVQFYRQ